MSRLASRQRRTYFLLDRLATLSGLILMFFSPMVALQAQETPQSTRASSPVSDNPPNARTREDKRYTIGVGDVLDIRVFGRPQLTRDAVRVDDRGKIRMPLLQDEIQASCRTERELAADIGTRYLKYVRRPQVDVFIREYNSQPVAVVGAVHTPGRFQLQRPVRLLELLTFAGGPTVSAGRSIQIVHAETSLACEEPGSTSGEAGVTAYGLTDVLAGRDLANPYVRPGDIVSILEADQVFVVGNVIRPSSIPLKEPLTVSRAIAMAGGVAAYSKSDRVRIIRQLPEGTKTEIFVDLKAIEKQHAADIALQANDIIDVPVSGGRRLLGSLVGSVVPAVTQMPVRIIP
ncbi:MAG TPA: polysaccharide biosynthesis/export family protein [Pyrinomonadaceae bacterium]